MEDLVESILDYVRADYTDYAIMINGEWGSGKTHFWNNKIRKKIDSMKFNGKQYKTIYMSLYGISNLEDISKKIFIETTQLMDKNLKKYMNQHEEMTIPEYAKTGLDMANFFGNGSNGGKLDYEEFFSTDDKVLCFDDLERANVDVIDILGYINNFVEHDHIKTIIICNEKELSTKLKSSNIEMKTFIATYLLDKQGELNTTDKPMVEKIRNKIEHVFDKANDYERIKEKLVGETFEYAPQFDYIINGILMRYENEPEIKNLLDIAMGLEGMPRQASTHACGIVITKDPVDTYVPLYVRDNLISTQYIMTTLEELGLLKMDFLGLRTLTVIQDTINLVKQNRGINVEYDKDMSDPKVYKLWQDGDTVGIFQFESQGITNFMKELKPDCLEDIVAGVSLYRPGPMDQIPRYIANKKDPEHAIYTHPALKPILKVTYGCMVYQEQVMQIVRDLAGYSLGRADLVRRAMGKKKLDVMAKEREYFIHGQTDENGNIIIPGCVRNGIDEQSANKIFDEMAEFAKYAFNKSHAAAYAVVSYRTAYLKAYYPAEFMAATLNSFLGNLDKVPLYIDECKRMNIQILKPEINKSFTKFTVEDGKIRFGLGSIKNVGIPVLEAIVKNREEQGQFKDLADFCERMQNDSVNKKCIESLIKSGAMDEFNQTRATLLASYEDIVDSINTSSKRSLKGQITMFDMGGENDDELEKIKYNYTILDEFSEKELLAMEKEMLGLYITGHPLESLRHEIEVQTNINTLQMREAKEEEQETGKVIYKDGQNVKFAGIISSIKKKYTKTNKLMAFVTIEDLYGSCEVIVFENCYMNSSDVLIEDNIVMCEGRLSIREDEDTKIVANKITKFGSKSSRILKIDITDISEEQKEKLRGAIKFFAGDRNNIAVKIINGDTSVMSGGIFINERIYNEFKEIAGSDRVSIEE